MGVSGIEVMRRAGRAIVSSGSDRGSSCASSDSRAFSSASMKASERGGVSLAFTGVGSRSGSKGATSAVTVFASTGVDIAGEIVAVSAAALSGVSLGLASSCLTVRAVLRRFGGASLRDVPRLRDGAAASSVVDAAESSGFFRARVFLGAAPFSAPAFPRRAGLAGGCVCSAAARISFSDVSGVSAFRACCSAIC